MKTTLSIFCILLLSLSSEAKIKVLIVDGQNNHEVWPKSTIIMKQYLEETGLFSVDIKRTRFTWMGEREKDYLPLAGVGETQDLKEPKTDPDFVLSFKKYDVVVSNFGWRAADWPEATQKALEKFMKDGGGFVSVHAADNSFPNWLEYNKMIGLGGWGDRTEKMGRMFIIPTMANWFAILHQVVPERMGHNISFRLPFVWPTIPLQKGCLRFG